DELLEPGFEVQPVVQDQIRLGGLRDVPGSRLVAVDLRADLSDRLDLQVLTGDVLRDVLQHRERGQHRAHVPVAALGEPVGPATVRCRQRSDRTRDRSTHTPSSATRHHVFLSPCVQSSAYRTSASIPLRHPVGREGRRARSAQCGAAVRRGSRLGTHEPARPRHADPFPPITSAAGRYRRNGAARLATEPGRARHGALARSVTEPWPAPPRPPGPDSPTHSPDHIRCRSISGERSGASRHDAPTSPRHGALARSVTEPWPAPQRPPGPDTPTRSPDHIRCRSISEERSGASRHDAPTSPRHGAWPRPPAPRHGRSSAPRASPPWASPPCASPPCAPRLPAQCRPASEPSAKVPWARRRPWTG